MKEVLKRGLTSFALSAFAGLLVNLIIDVIMSSVLKTGFISMSPDYVAFFPSVTIAAYVNILLYGVIGATFSLAAYIYEVEKIGFIIQSIIYFIITSSVCVGITILLWQLHKYPAAFISTLAGYLATHIIMMVIEYRRLKADIKVINELSSEE
jgi:protein-S-isoprenylcysteine O-methyltransferase Ste14